MAYPIRPNIPNPYQIVGQAAQELGGQVQQYGQTQDALQERFRLMMEKRAAAELQKQEAERELQFKQAEEERKQKEFEAKAKRDADRQKFFSRQPGQDGAAPYSPMELQNALATGMIDASEYKILGPKEAPAPPSKVQEYEYAKKNGFQGSFNDFIRPPKIETAPTIGSFEDYVSRTYGVNPTPQQIIEARRNYGGTADPGAKVFQQENTLRDEFNKKTEPFEKAYTAYDKMSRAIESNNAADAYAAVIDFVKTLDPGSTVREGEYTTAKSAGAGGSYGRLKQSIRNLYDGKMTPEVRKTLLEAGQNLMAAEKASYDRIRADYKKRVEGYNQRGVNLDTTAVLSTYPNVNLSAPETKVWRGVTYVLTPGADRKNPKSWVPQK